MKRKRILALLGVFIVGIFVFFMGCKNENYEFHQGLQGPSFDPEQPVTVISVMPDSGKIREKVIITGSNFGNDPSKVKVYFNDGFSDKEAIVVSANGTSIYCLAPRQGTGDNHIKVSLAEGDTIVAPATFHYTAAANVSWVAGVGVLDGVGAKYTDGSLSEAHFWEIQGIAALGDGQMITFGNWEDLANKVRFISVNDDRVTTLQHGLYAGKPAVNEDKTLVYNTAMNPPHMVYEYRKENGWSPYTIGEIVVPKYTECCDRIRSLVMMDKAHDPNQEWLYFCHKNATFARFNISTGQTEIIADATLSVPVRAWPGYMVYDKFKDCFYVSLYESFSIYRITRTGADWGDGVKVELYAGSPNQADVIDGNLTDARFYEPMGMCMDEEGNLYVCDGSADVIRKISAIDGYVSTIAGILHTTGAINGEPEKSTFLVPYDISYDGEGNFYIAEFWESTIRKYSIE